MNSSFWDCEIDRGTPLLFWRSLPAFGGECAFLVGSKDAQKRSKPFVQSWKICSCQPSTDFARASEPCGSVPNSLLGTPKNLARSSSRRPSGWASNQVWTSQMLEITDFLEPRGNIGKSLVHYSAVLPVNSDVERKITGITSDFPGPTTVKLETVRSGSEVRRFISKSRTDERESPRRRTHAHTLILKFAKEKRLPN